MYSFRTVINSGVTGITVFERASAVYVRLTFHHILPVTPVCRCKNCREWTTRTLPKRMFFIVELFSHIKWYIITCWLWKRSKNMTCSMFNPRFIRHLVDRLCGYVFPTIHLSYLKITTPSLGKRCGISTTFVVHSLLNLVRVKLVWSSHLHLYNNFRYRLYFSNSWDGN